LLGTTAHLRATFAFMPMAVATTARDAAWSL
jgi:hypothetical protein